MKTFFLTLPLVCVHLCWSHVCEVRDDVCFRNTLEYETALSMAAL